MKIAKKLLICAEADGALDKARKHKKRQLEDTLNLVMKKRKASFSFHILWHYISFSAIFVGII